MKSIFAIAAILAAVSYAAPMPQAEDFVDSFNSFDSVPQTGMPHSKFESPNFNEFDFAGAGNEEGFAGLNSVRSRPPAGFKDPGFDFVGAGNDIPVGDFGGSALGEFDEADQVLGGDDFEDTEDIQGLDWSQEGMPSQFDFGDSVEEDQGLGWTEEDISSQFVGSEDVQGMDWSEKGMPSEFDLGQGSEVDEEGIDWSGQDMPDQFDFDNGPEEEFGDAGSELNVTPLDEGDFPTRNFF